MSRDPNLSTRDRGQDLDAVSAVDRRVGRFTTEVVAIHEDTCEQANIPLRIEDELEEAGMLRFDRLDALPDGTTLDFDLALTVGGPNVTAKNIELFCSKLRTQPKFTHSKNTW